MQPWSALSSLEDSTAERQETVSASSKRGKVWLTVGCAASAFLSGAIMARLFWPRPYPPREVLPEVKSLAFGSSTSSSIVAELEEDNAALRKQVLLLQQSHSASAPIVQESARLLEGQSWQRPRASGRKWAYVTMAYDPPGRAEHLWQVLPIARALQRMSSYPLVVLTNTSQFPDGTWVAPALRRLNAKVMPVFAIESAGSKRLANPAWKVAFWKIQVWALTQYEKLIWLDADSILYRSLDSLFERPGMWAQRDDWFCHMNQKGVCSGIMLLYPNLSDFEGMLELDRSSKGFRMGDQELISEYFQHVRETPIHLLDDGEASFGQCLGKASTPYRNSDGTSVRGVWSTPSFIHKSGGWGDTDDNEYNNVCFSHNLSRQYYTVGGSVLNVCHYHPLGSYWRSLFCEAVAVAEFPDIPSVNSFCKDSCWYRGGQGDCKIVDTPVFGASLYKGTPGLPDLVLQEAVVAQVSSVSVPAR